MSVIAAERRNISSTAVAMAGGRQRRAEPVTDRVRRDGKFFRVGGEKFFGKGGTYGPFAPNRAGLPLPERGQVRKDFEQIRVPATAGRRDWARTGHTSRPSRK